MKKVLIALLAVLLLLSFTSCEKDKSEEVIAAYEEYCKVCSVGSWAYASFKYPESGSVNFTSLTKDNISENQLSYCLDYLDGSWLDKVDAVEGSVTGTYSKTDADITFKGVKITYYVEGDSTTKHELTIDGTFKFTQNTDMTTGKVEANMTINGNAFAFSYTVENSKYTAASVNGKSVDVRILNSQQILYMA